MIHNNFGRYKFLSEGVTMRNIKVKKEELLATLLKNRENHRAIFLEAQKAYREQVILELDKMLDEARSGKRIRRAVSLVEPIDQTGEYDRAIKMLEMSVDEVIELDEPQFRQLVMDQWAWTGTFLASNMRYSKTAEDIMAANQSIEP